jgi:hypothetical protein
LTGTARMLINNIALQGDSKAQRKANLCLFCLPFSLHLVQRLIFNGSIGCDGGHMLQSTRDYRFISWRAHLLLTRTRRQAAEDLVSVVVQISRERQPETWLTGA